MLILDKANFTLFLKLLLELLHVLVYLWVFHGSVWAINFSYNGILLAAQGEWILSGKDSCDNSRTFNLCMYAIKCINVGFSKDPFLTQVSEFAVLFGNELDAEVHVFFFPVLFFN